MAACTQCGRKTSWLPRVYAAGNEFCGTECRGEWLGKRAAAQETELKAEEAEQTAKEAARLTHMEESKAAGTAWAAQRKQARLARSKEAQQQLRREVAKVVASERKSPGDPYPRLALARMFSQAKGAQAGKNAKDNYERAFAINIPHPEDSALARWEYANLLVRTGREFAYGSQKDRQWVNVRDLGAIDDSRLADSRFRNGFLNSAPDVAHQLRVALDDVKRRLRNVPDDRESLKLGIQVGRLLGRRTADWEEQLLLIGKRPPAQGVRRRTQRPTESSGRAFEQTCLDVVRKLGLRAVVTNVTGDGGIDIIAFSDHPLLRGRCVIQCKDWSAPVGEPALRDLLGVVTAEDALQGILITSSTFTPAALRFAKGKRLQLIDGPELANIQQLTEPIESPGRE